MTHPNPLLARAEALFAALDEYPDNAYDNPAVEKIQTELDVIARQLCREVKQ